MMVMIMMMRVSIVSVVEARTIGSGIKAHALNIAATDDFSILPTTFDALVGVFVESGKVFPEFLVGRGYRITILHGGEPASQLPEGVGVELVLM